MTKLTKISRYGEVFAKILMILLAIAMIVMVIMLVAVAFNTEILTEALEEVGTTFDIPAEDLNVMAIATMLTVCVLVVGALGIAILYFVNRMFENICKNNTPFTKDNARYLVVIATLIIVCTIAVPILDFGLQRVLDTAYYPSYGFGLMPLFVAFLLYFLSLVFKHGAELQKESDETL